MKTEFTKRDTQSVKGVAILCMLFYHLFEHEERITTLQVDYSPLSMDTFLLISGFGNICVAVFVFLSSYGITKSILYLKEDVFLQSAYKQALVRGLKLISNFCLMFISVNILWYSKFNYVGLYGKGWQGALYVLLDALGFASFFDTPTLNATWWYMELAIVIIFIVPILYLLVKKLGKYSLILAMILPIIVEMNYDIKRYYMVILLGILAAHEKWLERGFALKCPLGLQRGIGIAVLAGCIVFRQNYVVYHEFGYVVDAPIALFFSWLVVILVSENSRIGKCLSFLGRYSMNIYFVHTFFYMAIYQSFIYSFRHAIIIFVVLVLVSTLYSVALESVKKLLLRVKNCFINLQN